MRKVKSEIERYDIVIFTETHLDRKEEDISKMGKYLHEYNVYNVHDKDRSSTWNGVTMCVKKMIVRIENISVQTDTGEREEGRWLKIIIMKAFDKPLNIRGIYAPTKAKNRKECIKEFVKELKKTKG